MSSAITAGQLRAELGRVLEKDPECRLMAWRTSIEYAGPQVLELQGRRFEVVSPRSPLEFHQLMLQAGQGQRSLACLVRLDESQLSQDLIRRLPRRRILEMDAWESVKQRFRAREVDPWLRQEANLAQLLLDAEPPTCFAPAPGAVLTTDHAWPYLLEYLFGLPPDATNPISLFQWSMQPTSKLRGQEHLAPLATYWTRRQGELAKPWLQLLCESPQDLVPLGLLGEVLFAPEALGTTTQAAACARLELRLGGHALTPEQGRAWFQHSRQALESSAQQRGPVIARAEQLLTDLGAKPLLEFSTLLPGSFHIRLARLAAALKPGSDSNLADSLVLLREHRQAAEQPERVETAEMATRLRRWLSAPTASATPDLAAQLSWYVSDGAFVDRARNTLHKGDAEPHFNQAILDLNVEARRLREERNLDFGRALAGWHQAGAALGEVLGVEHFLPEILVPLARNHRVLLIVLDGCSSSVLSQLLEDLPSLGLAPYRHQRWPALVSMLPSVTEWSRTSLLSGQVLLGDSSIESSRFASHPGLLSSCRKSPPLLFHKGAVQDTSGGVKTDLLRKVESDQHKVVGVVINAIDDSLTKDDQLSYAWRISTIRPLGSLISTAQRSGRVVVLVSDHGHLLEQGTHPIAATHGGERWITPQQDPPGPDWLDVDGPRLPEKVRLAASETVRVGLRKNGYHGGATPQEVVCALRLIAPPGKTISGWVETAEPPPTWWSPLPALPNLNLPGLATTKVDPTGQLGLFDPPKSEVSLTHRLLDSPLFRQQCKALAVSLTKLAPLEGLLEVLVTLPSPLALQSLAEKLDRPAAKVRDQIEFASRLLNLDGHSVLSSDGRSITVDRALMEQAFELAPLGHVILPVLDRTGRRRELRLPFALKPAERKLMERLAREGHLSELQAVEAAGSKRGPGLLADLANRLAEAGYKYLHVETSGPEGAVYRFEG